MSSDIPPDVDSDEEFSREVTVIAEKTEIMRRLRAVYMEDSRVVAVLYPRIAELASRTMSWADLFSDLTDLVSASVPTNQGEVNYDRVWWAMRGVDFVNAIIEPSSEEGPTGSSRK